MELAAMQWEEYETPTFVRKVKLDILARIEERDQEAAANVARAVFDQVLAETHWPELAAAAFARVVDITDEIYQKLDEMRQRDQGST